MALSLDLDHIDRINDGREDYDSMYDGYLHHQLGNSLPFTRIGVVEDSELTANSTLAGVDPTTALKWQCQDKIVVMGLVFGSVVLCVTFILGLFLFFRRPRKKGNIVCAQEIGSSPAHPQLDSGFLSHLVPQQDSARETLDYGDTASKANRYPSTAGIGGTAHFKQFPACPSVVATNASATNSNTTVSSFEDFLLSATPPPPPEHDALPFKVWALPKTGQCKSETSSSPPAYIAESDVGSVQGNRVIPQLDVPPVALLRPLSLSFVNGQQGSPSTSQDPGKAHNSRVPFDQWRFGL